MHRGQGAAPPRYWKARTAARIRTPAIASARLAVRGGMTEIRIMFSRYSAFYSPLIATKAAGFLAAEGLEAVFSVASPTDVPRARLGDRSVDLIQSAVSAS